VDGQSYDAERWGQYFRPAGVMLADMAETPDAEPSAPAAKPALKTVPKAEVAEEDEAPAAAAPVQAAVKSQKADDILAMIRARQAKQ
jgi:hypothetical protein